VSRDGLGEKWLRRLHRITGLDIHHASASGYDVQFTTTDHRHGWLDMKAWKYDPDGDKVWGLSDGCPNFTSCQAFKESSVTTTRQRMTTIGRVPDGIAESPVMLAALRKIAVDGWRERVAALPGAAAVGDPEVTTPDNVLYGCEIIDADDEPILDEDGQPAVDRDRLFMHVSGWVDLPQDVFDQQEAEAEALRATALAAYAERQQ